jgi:hypothetical protein
MGAYLASTATNFSYIRLNITLLFKFLYIELIIKSVIFLNSLNS